jgi:hypothetical protein
MKNDKKTSTDLQTLHRKLKIDTNLTEGELGMNSDDPEGLEVKFVDHKLEGCNEIWVSRL